MKTIIPFILLFLLWGCNKSVRSNKKFHGEWKPYSIKLMESNNIGNYVDHSGSITVQYDSKKSNSGTIAFDLSYDHNGITEYYQKQGTYLIEGEDLTLYYTADTVEAQLVYINNTDCELLLPLGNFETLFLVLQK